jgi:hypothetical protein
MTLLERFEEEPPHFGEQCLVTEEEIRRAIAIAQAVDEWKDGMGKRLQSIAVESILIRAEELLRGKTAMTNSTKIRPSVRWFADRMEEELRANEDKGGWSRCSVRWLRERIDDELRELDASSSPEAVIAECADAANFLMMIADNAMATLGNRP